MIGKKDVEHVARLARIELSEAEKEKFGKDLSGILHFVDTLNEINTAGTEPLAGGFSKKTSGALDEESRPDEVTPPLGGSAELVNAAPEKNEGRIEVRAVFKDLP